METFKAGVIQFDVKSGQIESNIKAILYHLEKLASSGVQLAILPEMFSCSFDNEHLETHVKNSYRVLDELSKAATRFNIRISGSIPVENSGHINNTQIFIDSSGSVTHVYEKTHLFRLTGEHHFYTPGNRIGIIETDLCRLGFIICYDLRFPELARTMALNGVKTIVASAQWPKPRQNHWKTLLTARAIENQIFMIGCNRTGNDGELEFPGMSMIVDPFGNILFEADESSQTGYTNIDLALVHEAQKTIPCRMDRRPDIYGKDC